MSDESHGQQRNPVTFEHVKKGDKVIRMLAGVHRMELAVTAVTDDRIICGVPGSNIDGYQFHRIYGYEIDEELGWGVPVAGPDGHVSTKSGSYLTQE